jgi:hypothetical protein
MLPSMCLPRPLTQLATLSPAYNMPVPLAAIFVKM